MLDAIKKAQEIKWLQGGKDPVFILFLFGPKNFWVSNKIKHTVQKNKENVKDVTRHQ